MLQLQTLSTDRFCRMSACLSAREGIGGDSPQETGTLGTGNEDLLASVTRATASEGLFESEIRDTGRGILAMGKEA